MQGDRSLLETPDSGRGPAGLPSSPGRAFSSLDRASGRDAPELEVGTGAVGRSPVLKQLRGAPAQPDVGSGFHKLASGAGSGRRRFPKV